MAGAVNERAPRAPGPTSAAAWALLLWPAWAAALGPAQPFQPPSPAQGHAAEAQPQTAGLTGVRLGTAPAALIDGTWVALGASARGARVAEVHPRHVLLRYPDRRAVRLAMAEDRARPPADTEAEPPPNRLVVKKIRP